MPYARCYTTFEVRQLLQEAEGIASPVTGADAHSRGLHALRTPGGVGVSPADMMHRTHKQAGESTSQLKARGGTGTTSAFANLIQQADAACQALNAEVGQVGLTIFDLPAHASRPLRLILRVAGIREIGFLPATGQGRMTSASKNGAAVARAAAAGVAVIVDRAPGAAGIHIQTCFPLGADPSLQSSYEVRDIATNALVATGKSTV
jgi:hypothetical protein